MYINNSGKSFVTIMLAVAISLLALRIGIDQIMRFGISSNQSYAEGNLKLISQALENYARNHEGLYPATMGELTKTTPAYLDRDYISESPIKGYNYVCQRMDPGSYSCSALPVKCSITGSMVFTVSTGGIISSEECSKKE